MVSKTNVSNKYRIYSSDAGHAPSENVLILTQNTLIDHLVASLKDKVINLSGRPAAGTYTTFDPPG